MSIDDTSQTVDCNAAAADDDAITDATTPSADNAAPAADATRPPSPGSAANAANAAKAAAAAAAVAAKTAASRRGGRRGERGSQTMNLFVLDQVYHAKATNAPLSGRPAECKMRNFQPAQPAQPAQPGLGYPGTLRDKNSHTGILYLKVYSIPTYTDIGKNTS